MRNNTGNTSLYIEEDLKERILESAKKNRRTLRAEICTLCEIGLTELEKRENISK